MLIESFYILTLVAGGGIALRSLGLKGWATLPLGFLLGIASFITIGYIQAIAGISTTPIIGLAAMWLMILAIFLRAKRRGHQLDLNSTGILAGAVIVLALVGTLRVANLAKYHYDPFRYLMTAALVEADKTEALSTNLLTKRFSSVPLIHAPAGLSDEFYIPSVTPLISLALLATLYWLVMRCLGEKEQFIGKVAGSMAIALLITNRSYLWHSFYLNGHLLMGAFSLLVVGVSYVLVAKKNKDKKALVLVLASSIIGSVLTRPEAAVFTAAAIAPLLLSDAEDFYKKTALWSFSFGLLLQQGFIVRGLVLLSERIPSATKALVIAALMAIGLTRFLNWKLVSRNRSRLLGLAELAPWAALAGLAAVKPNRLADSLSATYQNTILGQGAWGWSLIVLAALALLAAMFQFNHRRNLRFAASTFLPLALLLPYVRAGGAYRVGITDSLNRMFIQIVPVVALFVVVALVTGSWRLPWLRERNE